jgi:two-component system OmpR family response regulator
MSRILLIEDDPVLGKGVKLGLELEGYGVEWVRDLRSAKAANDAEKFELAILDLGLPDGNGLSFCSGLRAAGSRMPILILTAKTDEDTVVAGLTAGANDYIRKPFGSRELVARIKNTLREPSTREDQVRFGDILILKAQRRVMFSEVEIDLNRREFDIFCFLVDHGGAVVSRAQILDHLDREGEILDRTLDSHLSHIRKKLRDAGVGSVKIAPVYGVGYRMEKQ